jgi:hypothetical protein
MTRDPLTALRHGLDHYEYGRDRDEEDAALAAVKLLVQAHRRLFSFAAVSWEGDPWYAESEGLNGEAILAESRDALAPFEEDA